MYIVHHGRRAELYSIFNLLVIIYSTRKFQSFSMLESFQFQSEFQKSNIQIHAAFMGIYFMGILDQMQCLGAEFSLAFCQRKTMSHNTLFGSCSSNKFTLFYLFFLVFTSPFILPLLATKLITSLTSVQTN